MKKTFFIISFLLLLSSVAQARPVSYPGGWTAMTMNDYKKNNLHIHYSPTAKYSVGFESSYIKGEGDHQTYALKVVNLLKRWNNDDSQANIYLRSGLGLAYEGENDYNDSQFMGFSGIALDWENRRFFTEYTNNFHYAGDISKEYSQSVRVGIAPYLGDYGDLHTWIMLRVDHNPEDDDNIVLLPHIRFFKGEYLFEIGYSDNDEVLANFVIRF